MRHLLVPCVAEVDIVSELLFRGDNAIHTNDLYALKFHHIARKAVVPYHIKIRPWRAQVKTVAWHGCRANPNYGGVWALGTYLPDDKV